MINKETLIILIYICGIYSICFAIFHLYFWKLFDWKNELKKINVANRAIIQIANLKLIYIFTFVGLVCFVFPIELLSTKLGNVLLLGNSLFWLTRIIEQFIFLKVKSRMLNLLTFFFVLGTILFASPVFLKLVFFKPCL